MKQLFFLSAVVVVLFVVSCTSYTADQKAAATFVCDCMEKDVNGIADQGMLYFLCFEEQAKQQFDTAVFTDEGYANALFEICPDQNLVTDDSER